MLSSTVYCSVSFNIVRTNCTVGFAVSQYTFHLIFESFVNNRSCVLPKTFQEAALVQVFVDWKDPRMFHPTLLSLTTYLEGNQVFGWEQSKTKSYLQFCLVNEHGPLGTLYHEFLNTETNTMAPSGCSHHFSIPSDHHHQYDAHWHHPDKTLTHQSWQSQETRGNHKWKRLREDLVQWSLYQRIWEWAPASSWSKALWKTYVTPTSSRIS